MDEHNHLDIYIYCSYIPDYLLYIIAVDLTKIYAALIAGL